MGFFNWGKTNNTDNTDNTDNTATDNSQDLTPSTEKTKVLNFIVRVDFNPNFIWQQGLGYVESQEPMNKLYEALGDYVVNRRIDCCRSFTVFYAADVNAGAVEKKVKKVWEGIYGNFKDAIQVLAYAVDDGPVYEVLHEIYCAYIGWSEYCNLVTEIAYELPLVEQSNTKNFVMEQNYLVSMDEGCGFSTMLSSFCDFMARIGYLPNDKSGTLEYIINEDEEANDTTTASLLDTLWDDDTKERCIGLDISYFLPKEKHSELRTFLKRLYKLQTTYIFMFHIPYLEEKARKEIFDIIEDVVSVKQIVIEPYNELIYGECFDDVLIKHNISVTNDTIEKFLERVRLEKRDGRFYGYKTVRKIAEESALLKIKHDAKAMKNGDEPDVTLMNPEDIEGILDEFKVSDKTGYDELHELIGMEEIERRIREIVAQVKLAKSNEKLEVPCLHMRFTGAPGTGKTTVARIIGKIFKDEGILRKGNFFEHGARDLCGKYIGQTAPKTSQICRDAYGSVLFIDEAYALYAGDNDAIQNDYGREAIATLIAEMENHRDDMVVIMAGYTDDMDKLMEANSGLRSRMPYIIEFKSYKREQLADIFMNYVNRHFTAGAGLKEAVNTYFDSLEDSFLKSKEFANARFVRNLYERTWSKAALRITNTGISDIELTVADFESAKADKEFSEKLAVTRKIGF